MAQLNICMLSVSTVDTDTVYMLCHILPHMSRWQQDVCTRAESKGSLSFWILSSHWNLHYFRDYMCFLSRVKTILCTQRTFCTVTVALCPLQICCWKIEPELCPGYHQLHTTPRGWSSICRGGTVSASVRSATSRTACGPCRPHPTVLPAALPTPWITATWTLRSWSKWVKLVNHLSSNLAHLSYSHIFSEIHWNVCSLRQTQKTKGLHKTWLNDWTAAYPGWSAQLGHQLKQECQTHFPGHVCSQRASCNWATI